MYNKPRLNYVDKEGIETIHNAALEILSKYGMKVEDENIRNLFKENGCIVDGDRVKIHEDLINKMIDNKKNVIDIYDAEGKPFRLEPNKTGTHAPGGVPFLIDHNTGNIRDAVEADFINAIQVMNNMEELDLPCALVSPSDIPSEINQLRQCELMFKYCKKPIYGPGISSATEIDYIVELFDICSDGDIQNKPRGLVGVSPESPLYIPKEISYILKRTIESGIPVAILAAPLPGISSVYTIAGSMAQVHAEIIAMAVLAYLFNPKTPVMYGSRVTFANMRTGNATWGIPEMGICGGIASQLASRLNMIPDVYGTATSSCTFDSQSGFEKGVNGLLPFLIGGELISGFGTMASNMVISLEQLIIDNEYYKMLKKVAKGFEISDEKLGLDTLDSVLNGSQFIMEMHTVDNLRNGEIFEPKLGFQGVFGDWQNNGKKGIDDIAREKLVDILEEEPKIILEEDKLDAISSVIERAKKDLL